MRDACVMRCRLRLLRSLEAHIISMYVLVPIASCPAIQQSSNPGGLSDFYSQTALFATTKVVVLGRDRVSPGRLDQKSSIDLIGLFEVRAKHLLAYLLVTTLLYLVLLTRDKIVRGCEIDHY